MQNRRDNECLKWSLRALLFPSPKGRKPLRTTSYLTDDEMSVNHSTKWTNESKTIKKVVRIVSNHCFFATKYRDAVRDHCHMTRKYRGAAHYTCNLNLRIRPEQNPIPFFLKGYDAHLLFQEKAKKKGKKLTCIPNNMETNISFSLGGGGGCLHLQFELSASIAGSLDALAKNLPRKALKHTAKHTQNKKQRNLLGQKEVYPYEYIDGWERFSETKLPPKSLFYSSLNDEHITQKQCKHAKKVWKVFKRKTWGTIVIFISKRMSACRWMFLRTSEASA